MKKQTPETESEIKSENTFKRCKPWNLGIKLENLPIKTPSIESLLKAYYEDHSDMILVSGEAGTAKTTTAVYIALKELLDKNSPIEKIVIFRSIVSSNDIGFLPGNEYEKCSPYDIYRSHIEFLTKNEDAYDLLLKNKSIEFRPTTYEQGKTYKNTFMILDEFENSTFRELELMLTRAGENSKVIYCGDLAQSYIKEKEHDGIFDFIDIVKELNEVKIVKFSPDDCLRHGLVKSYLKKKNQLIKENKLKIFKEIKRKVLTNQ